MNAFVPHCGACGHSLPQCQCQTSAMQIAPPIVPPVLPTPPRVHLYGLPHGRCLLRVRAAAITTTNPGRGRVELERAHSRAEGHAMIWRWSHLLGIVASAALWIALWYGVGALLYWLFEGR